MAANKMHQVDLQTRYKKWNALKEALQLIDTIVDIAMVIVCKRSCKKTKIQPIAIDSHIKSIHKGSAYWIMCNVAMTRFRFCREFTLNKLIFDNILIHLQYAYTSTYRLNQKCIGSIYKFCTRNGTLRKRYSRSTS